MDSNTHNPHDIWEKEVSIFMSKAQGKEAHENGHALRARIHWLVRLF